MSESWDSILIIVDRLSKYAHFIGLKNPFSAATVAAVFAREIVRLHGIPRSIVSDCDKIFLSKFWGEHFRLQGTILRFSTTYHPQSDGQTEVFNRCLETYLRCLQITNPSSGVTIYEYWYNTSFHTTAHTTPFRRVYGRDPPPLLSYEVGSSVFCEVDQQLLDRDTILLELC